MADLNLAIQITAKDLASAPIKGVGKSLQGLAGAPAKAVGGVVDGLGKLGLAGMGVSALTSGVGGLADALGFGLANQMEQATAQFNAFTKDQAKSAEIIEMVRVEAAKTPFTFQEMTMAAAGLLPVTKASGESLQDLLKDAEVLSASNPMQGFEGAVFSLREAVTGDFTSIIERFNLSRSTINKLKDEGVPNIEIVRRAMLEMGFDSDLVSAKAQTLEGSWSTFSDTIDTLKMKMGQPIFDIAKEGLGALGQVLTDNMDTLENFAQLVGQGIMNAFRTAQTVIQALLDKLQPFFKAFQDNLPKLQAFAEQVGFLFEGLGHAIGQVFSGGVEDALGDFQDTISEIGPNLVTQLQSWAQAFLGWIGPMIPPLIAQMMDLWRTLREWILGTAMPAIIETLGGWAGAFIDWIAPMIPPMLRQLGQFVTDLTGWVVDVGLPMILTNLQKWGLALVEWIGPRVMPMLGELGKLLGDLGQWMLKTALPAITSRLAKWGSAFLSWVGEHILPNIGPTLGFILFGGPGWEGLFPWLTRQAQELARRLKDEWVPSFLGWVKDELLPKIPPTLKLILDKFGTWITQDAVPWIKQNVDSLGEAVVTAIRSGIESSWTGFIEWLRGKLGGLGGLIPGGGSPTPPSSGGGGGQWPNLVAGGMGSPTSAGTHGGHPAVDIFAPAGAAIFAPVAGRSMPGFFPLGGNTTTLQGQDGRWYYFAHAQAGMTGGNVSKGQVIGRVGNTGNARNTPSHLHFAAATNPSLFGSWNGSGDIWPSPGMFRARGGPVTAGGAYIVGEHGPEAFVPRSSGRIIPNGGLGFGGDIVLKLDGTVLARVTREQLLKLGTRNGNAFGSVGASTP